MTELIKRPSRPNLDIPISSVTRMTQEQEQEVKVGDLSPSDIEWCKEAKRPIAVILADLSKTLPDKYLERLKDKGNALYIPWYHAISLLDRCTGGHWEYRITKMWTTPKRIFIVVEITIYAAEGAFTRAATGTEVLEREIWDKDLQKMVIKELAYGDPSSNAESMALRRAAAKFGLARYLYQD